jgi:hypothetical protein
MGCQSEISPWSWKEKALAGGAQQGGLRKSSAVLKPPAFFNVMSETPIDEATSGDVPPEIVEVCREKALKSLLAEPHTTEEGTLEINGVKSHYKFTKPLPQKGSDGGDAVVHFHGVLEMAGKSAVPYTITRLDRGDWTESWISINGNKAHVVRDPLPQSVTYEGKVEVQVPSPFFYKVTQTIRRGEAALEREELEGILTAQAVADCGGSKPTSTLKLLDLIRDNKARRRRRLQARSRVAAE